MSEATLDNLLATYQRDIYEGKKPSSENYLRECPPQLRSELKKLMCLTVILKRQREFQEQDKAFKAFVDQTVDNMIKGLRSKHTPSSQGTTSVAARLSGDLTPEEDAAVQQSIEEELLKI
jgi:L-serine deaminase